jgi:hypothetical protein
LLADGRIRILTRVTDIRRYPLPCTGTCFHLLTIVLRSTITFVCESPVRATVVNYLKILLTYITMQCYCCGTVTIFYGSGSDF